MTCLRKMEIDRRFNAIGRPARAGDLPWMAALVRLSHEPGGSAGLYRRPVSLGKREATPALRVQDGLLFAFPLPSMVLKNGALWTVSMNYKKTNRLGWRAVARWAEPESRACILRFSTRLHVLNHLNESAHDMFEKNGNRQALASNWAARRRRLCRGAFREALHPRPVEARAVQTARSPGRSGSARFAGRSLELLHSFPVPSIVS